MFMLNTKDYTVTRHENILQIQDISGESFILYKERKFTALRVASIFKNDFYNRMDPLLCSIPFSCL